MPPGPAEALRRARTLCAPSCAPRAWRPHSHAERTRRHRPGRGPGLAPRPGPAGLHRQQAGSEVGGRYHLYPHLGGVRVPGDRPRLLHQENSRVRDWGDNTWHRPLVCDLICEAIDMAARRCPYTRGETVFHSDRGCQYTSEQLARHLESYGIRPSVGRTGVCWDNAWAEVGGCDPQGTRGSIRWCIPQEARPSGILPPGSSWNTIRNDSTPPWGTGRPTRLRRSTEQ